MAETMVRMGEYAVSSVPGEILVALGLGSCIGLVLLDRRAAVAGLAHVVLPALVERNNGRATALDARSAGRPAFCASDTPGKFADTAAEALIAGIEALGGKRPRLQAVLVGGASMFPSAGARMEVGQRNDAAVRAELARLRIPVVAAATGGSRGRTVRVALDTGRVTAKEAGATEQELHAGWRARVAA